MKPAALKNWLRMAGMLATLVASTASHADKIYFVHNDHLGTPQVMTDENKNVVWEVDRDPWGNITNVLVNNLPNNVSLPGQYDDAETSYSDNWHRTYDKKLGQYFQFDPIGLAGGVNPYLYANANPVMFIDPTGLVSWTCTSLTMGGGLFVISGAHIRFKCVSECVDGYKTHVLIEVSAAGAGVGIDAEFVESRNDTIRDENDKANPNVFQGSYYEASANYTVGIGYGVSAVSFNNGAAKGVNYGPTGGIGMGAGEFSGASNVVSSWKEKCDDKCKP